jgi:type I restriction enzyme S subunit
MASRDISPFADLFETPLRNGLTKPKAVRGEGMKMVNMGEVFAHRRIHNLGMDRVPMDSKERDSNLLREGDLLFARQSLVLSGAGKCVLFQGDKEEVTFESHIIRCRLDQRKAVPAFYFYLFQSPQGRSLIETIVEQVAAAGIRGSDLGRLAVPVAPLAEQKAIAAVLGALDDKIELNCRTNATLEAMTLAMFQSWFVDFDPVRANLDGTRVAGVDKTIAALFPAHLEDSPLGKVPVGWRVLKFADVLTPHSVRVGEESVPEFSATVTGLSSRDERFKKQLSKSQSKNKRIVAGDLVFGFSREVINFGLMREPVGAVSPVYEVFKIDSSKIEPELLERLFRFNMPFYMDILKPGAREGKPIDRGYLLRKHLLVPDIAVQRAFLATIQPWTDKIKVNEVESRTLATLRDTLLPKLLSGELSVAEVEKEVTA